MVGLVLWCSSFVLRAKLWDNEKKRSNSSRSLEFMLQSDLCALASTFPARHESSVKQSTRNPLASIAEDSSGLNCDHQENVRYGVTLDVASRRQRFSNLDLIYLLINHEP
jgi:hypothetical protein